jgi:hypothetical protein
MSFSTIIRQVAQVTKRNVSSNAGKNPPHSSLPPPKMRALISLYHQAETFITPETLSERIDEAFIPRNLHSAFRTPVTMRDLENVLTDRRNAPRISEWDQEGVVLGQNAGYEMGDWSSVRAVREQKVIEALYGVDTTNDRFLPGLDVLEESAAQVQRGIREELEEYEDSKDRS